MAEGVEPYAPAIASCPPPGPDHHPQRMMLCPEEAPFPEPRVGKGVGSVVGRARTLRGRQALDVGSERLGIESQLSVACEHPRNGFVVAEVSRYNSPVFYHLVLGAVVL